MVGFAVFMLWVGYTMVTENILEAQSLRPADYKTQKLKKVVWEKVSNNLKRTPVVGGYLVIYNETAITFVPVKEVYDKDWNIYLPKKKRRR